MITRPVGFYAGGTSCGIKPSGSPDLAAVVSDRPCAAAGVFTTNRFCGAPVTVSRRHVRGGRARAIVCNSGVSNVGTGERGLRDAESMCHSLAAELSRHRVLGDRPLKGAEVLPASTGVIGQPLPMDRLAVGIASLAPTLDRGDEADEAAARAILTTDKRPKAAHRRVELSTGPVEIGGIAKGAGMISPHMATMLAFLTTDAAIEAAPLRRLLKRAVGRTFNRISIDSDTSTSDMALVLANGASGAAVESEADVAVFGEALGSLCRELAEQLVRDGEGVTRLMDVAVRGAATPLDADRVGRSVVDSPLVKTALHGGDPNWGRLVMAVGKSGAKLDPGSLTIRLGGVAVLEGGEPAALDSGDVDALRSLMRRDRVAVEIDLGMGDAEADWLGCDLSRDYIVINAEYTT